MAEASLTDLPLCQRAIADCWQFEQERDRVLADQEVARPFYGAMLILVLSTLAVARRAVGADAVVADAEHRAARDGRAGGRDPQCVWRLV